MPPSNSEPAALLSIESLFELSKEKRYSVPLLQFMTSCELPWELLGKQLAKFVESTVSAATIAGNSAIKNLDELRNRFPGVYFENWETIVIEQGATIEQGAYISGPTYIESRANVRHGAYIRGHVYLATESLVGHTTEVKNSLLLPGAKAAHFAYVGDSILGSDTNLGAGTKLANLRFDHGLVYVNWQGQRVSTGLKKFGAILGNRSQTGCNSVTNPGTICSPDCSIAPLKNVGGTVFNNKK